jgi:tetratricopeptide (TPR) repeat protein
MNDWAEELKRLIQKLPDAAQGGGIEFLLAQFEPDVAWHFRLCAIPHQFDVDILQILAPELDLKQARERIAEFAELSTVLPSEEGWAMHGNARDYLFDQWLKPDKIHEFSAASSRLAAYFQEAAKAAEGAALESLQYQCMFHMLGANQNVGFAMFEQLCRAARRQFHLSKCESLIKLVDEYNQVLNSKHRLALSYHEGKLAMDQRQWDTARHLFGCLVEDGETSIHLKQKAYRRLGFIDCQQRHWEAAIRFYQLALSLADSDPKSSQEKHLTLHELGVAYRDSGKLGEAQELLNASIRLATERRDLPSLATAYNSLGTLYLTHRDIPQAVTAFESSLGYLHQCGDHFRIAPVYNNLGLAYANEREWKKSQQFFEKSLDIVVQAGDTLAQAEALNNLVWVYQNTGQLQEAIAVSYQSSELLMQLGELYKAAVVRRNLGRLYRRAKDMTQATKAFQEVEKLFERVNARDEMNSVIAEREKLSKKIGLPWWAWVAICFIPAIVLLLILVMLLVE